MNKKLAVAALCLLFTTSAALAQRAADRASDRSDSTRAKTIDRLNRVQQDETETVVKEQVINVPVKLTTQAKGLMAGQRVNAKTKRVVVRRVETVPKPTPLKINPY